MYSLKTVLRLNALSCIVFGIVFAFAANATAAFLGSAPPVFIRITGVLLLFNGLHLVWASFRRVPKYELYYFVVGDLTWVTLTAILLGLGIWITTAAGIAAAIGVALVVGVLGIAQIGAAPAEPAAVPDADDHLPVHLPLLRSIGVSWNSMKLWIKVWLFGVNGAFLAALVFWPEPAAKFALAAYVASGPWLLAIMIAQRGLTRMLGIAHLIPWIPLTIYLILRLTSDMAGPRLVVGESWLATYAAVLLFVIGICQAFDIYDLARWIRGQQFRLGSPNAVKAGASNSV
jgi:hypothetical protein